MLLPESTPLLDNVAAVMNAHPEIKKALVEGHTDDRGDDASNLKLSTDRARACLDYLSEKKGIAASRLTSAGYGETKPIASNKTKEGREQNRRVVFTILK